MEKKEWNEVNEHLISTLKLLKDLFVRFKETSPVAALTLSQLNNPLAYIQIEMNQKLEEEDHESNVPAEILDFVSPFVILHGWSASSLNEKRCMRVAIEELMRCLDDLEPWVYEKQDAQLSILLDLYKNHLWMVHRHLDSMIH